MVRGRVYDAQVPKMHCDNEPFNLHEILWKTWASAFGRVYPRCFCTCLILWFARVSGVCFRFGGVVGGVGKHPFRFTHVPLSIPLSRQGRD